MLEPFVNVLDDFTSKLEKEMATHSSILARTMLCTEEPGGPQSMGLQSQTQLSVCTHTKINKGQLDSAIPEGPWNKGVRVRILVETSLEY